MFRIKICGITTLEDAQLCASVGADAIGLNFYAASSRSVTIDEAVRITLPLRGKLDLVGVFVNHPVEEVNQIATATKLDWVQLHGDEPPELLAHIDKSFQLLRVFRFQPGDQSRISDDLRACEAAGRLPDAVLLDAAVKGHYGGSGTAIAWEQLSGEWDFLHGLPLVLAGGLNPENVTEAVNVARPFAVDVASGVELEPGRKDPDKVSDFVAKAQASLRRI